MLSLPHPVNVSHFIAARVHSASPVFVEVRFLSPTLSVVRFGRCELCPNQAYISFAVYQYDANIKLSISLCMFRGESSVPCSIVAETFGAKMIPCMPLNALGLNKGNVLHISNAYIIGHTKQPGLSCRASGCVCPKRNIRKMTKRAQGAVACFLMRVDTISLVI